MCRGARVDSENVSGPAGKVSILMRLGEMNNRINSWQLFEPFTTSKVFVNHGSPGRNRAAWTQETGQFVFPFYE
jgi:hypothetical protein